MVSNVLRATLLIDEGRFISGSGQHKKVRRCVLNGFVRPSGVADVLQVSGWWLPAVFAVQGLGHRVTVRVEYQPVPLVSFRKGDDWAKFLGQSKQLKVRKPHFTVAVVDEAGLVVQVQHYAKMNPRITAVRVEPVGDEEVRMPLKELRAVCMQAAGLVGELRRVKDKTGERVQLVETEHSQTPVRVPRVRRTWTPQELEQVLQLKETVGHGNFQREVATTFGVTERNARAVIGRAKKYKKQQASKKKPKRKRGSK